jgi:hypothetical protein
MLRLGGLVANHGLAKTLLRHRHASGAERFAQLIDLDHLSIIGARQGIPNYLSFEIGKPVDVGFDKGTTFVKALIYSGSGQAAEKANLFWSSLTDIKPPKNWGASIGGSVLEKAIAVDPVSGEKYPVITKVRWTNIAASGQPVNPHLASVSTVPIGVLAKCWGKGGIDLRKSLQAGHEADFSALVGGSAIRGQSLDGAIATKRARVKRDVLARAMVALKANRITGAEASELEDALNRGVPLRAAVIERVLGELH